MNLSELRTGNKYRILLSLRMLLVFTVMYLLIVVPAEAAVTDSPQTVKVGYYYDGDIFKKSPERGYEGYGVEYLYEVAKYTNWHYEFVEFDGFESALNALQTGEIDILPNLFRTIEREEELLFTEEDMGKLYITLIVPQDDAKHLYNEYGTLTGMKVGILSSSVDGINFRKWDAEKGLQSEIVEMPSAQALLSALDSGELDAVAYTYMGPSEKYKIVAEFYPEYMYFGIPKEQGALVDQLNDAMDQIVVRNPEFKSGLYERYLITSRNGSHLSLTQDEHDYIAQGKSITVVLSSAGPPFSYVEDGSVHGAVPDLLHDISVRSGLKFHIVAVENQSEAIMMLQTNQAQIIAGLVENPSFMVSQGIRLTDPYMNVSMNEVVRNGTDQVCKIALPEAVKYVYENVQSRVKNASNCEVIYYPSVQACIDALDKKEVDSAFCSSYFVGYLFNHSRASNYTVTTLTGYSYNLCMGVGICADTRLFSILNKYVQNTDDATLNQLVLNHSLSGDESLLTIINHIPANAILLYTTVLLAAMVAMTVALVFLYKHAQKEKLLIAQQEKVRQEARMSARRTEFFGTASHDMRTPLNAILGFSDLALQADEADMIQTYLKKIQASGRLMLDLINDTLVIAKTDNHKFSLHLADVDSCRLIDEIVTPIRAAAAAKKVEFSVDLTAAYTGYIRADKLYVQKILLNLLSNAVKFTPHGGKVTFIAQFHQKDEANILWQVVIRDDGVGISEAFLPQIFELFSQEKSTTCESEVGTGMGLFIVKRLVEMMNGEIDVKSERNVGTEFTVSLPMETITCIETKVMDQRTYDCLKGKTILLCEDNRPNTEIATKLLQKKGMQVVCAKEGTMALELFNNSADFEFAAILMDIRMPGMNGYEVSRAIRQLQRRDAQTVPIIAVSADTFKEDIEKAKAAGMNAHIAKPLNPEHLYHTLYSVCED